MTQYQSTNPGNTWGDPAPRPETQTSAPQQPGRAMDESRRVADEAHRAADQVREKGSELVDRAKTHVDAAAQQTRRKAAEYADQARTQGQAALDGQKHRAADTLHTVGSAVHRAAEKLREERDDNLAGYADALAEEVDRMAGYLEHRPVSELMHDAQAFARRRPEWFLGGLFVAGLALSRFLKSSSRSQGGDGMSSRDLPERYRDSGAMDSLTATNNNSGSTSGLSTGMASTAPALDDLLIVDDGIATGPADTPASSNARFSPPDAPTIT